MAAGRRDLYSVLGVSRDVDEDTLRTTYRKLARELHPDVNPGDDKAEERFKEISQAYTVLSDPEKRKDYDEFGDVSLEAGFNAEAARAAGGAFRGGGGSGGPGRSQGFDFDLEDLFSQFGGAGFGARRGRHPQRGGDLEAEIQLGFEEAVGGTEKRITLTRPDRSGRPVPQNVTVRIPPGVSDGGRIRLRAKGQPGQNGGPPGDLWATVRVKPHRVFRREGRDLHIEVPVTVREAMLGAQIEIPTLDGRATLTLPAGTDSGKRLRLAGKGVPSPRGGAPGHLLVTVQIVVPKQLDPRVREAAETIAEAQDENPRDALFR